MTGLERAMGLPAGQQRILDAIEDGLRASEPRLASMFAIFTRLNRHEGQPPSEDLPGRTASRRRLGGIRRLLTVGRVKGAGCRARRPSRPPAGRGLRNRRDRLLRLSAVAIFAQIAVALVVVGLLIGFLGHAAARPCGAGSTGSTGSRVAAAHARGTECPSQAGRASAATPK
jgi:hypothetical protein